MSRKLISPQDAVRLCQRVTEYLHLASGSSSRFLRSFTPGVAQVHARLINDFFQDSDFAGKRILDIGPGLFPFALLARQLGAMVVAIEFDPALATIGRAMGFEVHEDDLDMLPEGKFENFDGVFLKGPFNPCRQSPQTIANAVRRLCDCIHDGGWGWCASSSRPVRLTKVRTRIDFAPYRRCADEWCRDASYDDPLHSRHGLMPYYYRSGIESIEPRVEISLVRSEQHRRHLERLQRECFQQHGWEAEVPDDDECKRYALTYINRPTVFTKRLRVLSRIRHGSEVGE